MLPQTVTVGPLASADDDNICQSQTPLAAGAMTINGAAATAGVATLDVARRVLITTVSDERAKTFRITGTNSDGNPIRETLTGPNATTGYTTQDFKTVTQVYVSAATTGAVTVGTNGIASSQWLFQSYQLSPVNISIGAVVTGTVNYTIEYTYSNINDNANAMGGALGNYPSTPIVWAHATIVTKTTTTDGFINDPVTAWRLTVNSGATGSDSVTATGIQAGIRGA